VFGKRTALLSALACALVLSVVSCSGTAPSDTPAPAETPGQVVAAREAALDYLVGHYGEQAPWCNFIWLEQETTQDGQIGQMIYQYAAGDWVVTISYPATEPEAVVYSVVVGNQSTGFKWKGTVDSEGAVIEQPGPALGQPAACWYGRVVGLPEGAQFDDYLALELEGAGQVGVEGVDREIDRQLGVLRDEQGPRGYAHFWGRLTCDVPDVGGCQLLVTRLRPEGPGALIPDPEPVEGWEGRIVSNPSGAQFDDYFVLAGDFGVGFGIGTSDPQLATQLESLRDTQTAVRVWGQVRCPAIDSFGAQIQVTRIEVIP
jgi:hypothetical protein